MFSEGLDTCLSIAQELISQQHPEDMEERALLFIGNIKLLIITIKNILKMQLDKTTDAQLRDKLDQTVKIMMDYINNFHHEFNKAIEYSTIPDAHQQNAKDSVENNAPPVDKMPHWGSDFSEPEK